MTAHNGRKDGAGGVICDRCGATWSPDDGPDRPCIDPEPLSADVVAENERVADAIRNLPPMRLWSGTDH